MDENLWVQISLTYSAGTQIRWTDEHHNTSGSGVSWPWAHAENCWWYVTGSATEGPPTWHEFLGTLRNDDWLESNSGTEWVPDGYWVVERTTIATTNVSQSFENSSNPQEVISRSGAKWDSTEIIAIVSPQQMDKSEEPG